MKKYLRWSIPMVPNAGILWIIHVSDRYMVSYYIDTAAAGIYSAAYSIGNYAYFALMPLGIVLYPNVVKTYDEGHPEQTANYLKYGLKYLHDDIDPQCLWPVRAGRAVDGPADQA